MKKSIFIIVIFAAVAGLFWLLENQTNQTPRLPPEKIGTSTTTRFTYYHDDDFGLELVLFHAPLEINYQTTPRLSLEELAKKNKYALAVNGNYFTPELTPAGLFAKNDLVEVPLAPRDTQLTHVVSLDATSTITFIPAASFATSSYQPTRGRVLFQTGPLMIEKNQITENYITKSLNGTGQYPRTLLGTTENGATFFAVSTRAHDLTTLAQKILDLDLFKNEIVSVINLDGGPSTALYSAEKSNFNVRVYKTLPLIFGVK